MSANRQNFVEAIAASFRSAGFEIASAPLGDDLVTVALRHRDEAVAALP